MKDTENLKISQLKKLCDTRFREYLLAKAERDSKNRIYCPITEKWYNEKYLDVVHYIDRSVMHYRYSEENCFLGSHYSNTHEAQIKKEGSKSLHHHKIEKFFGKEKTAKLLRGRKNLAIFEREMYLKLLKKWEKQTI